MNVAYLYLDLGIFISNVEIPNCDPVSSIIYSSSLVINSKIVLQIF
jgi:hypothetical protein